jgi:predicted 3-demethylubiquinone-9 3-methyltransferase (glyoxalase superfamily)
MKLKGIAPCLWYDSQAEEAAKFYVKVFKKSRIENVTRYPDVGQEIHGRPAGSVMMVTFVLAGQRLTALNGGPHFKFSEAISLMVFCDTQKEIDYYWAKLSADGGEESVCGWLKDKYGLSWQITSTALLKMNQDRNREKAGRAFGAMLKMKKLDIAALKRAYAGK